MGVCCNYLKKIKENEVIFPQNIKYNIFGIKEMSNNNTNNENIMTNDLDIISNSSQAFGRENKLDMDYSPYSPNKNNKYQKKISPIKSPFLGQIKEKDQNREANKLMKNNYRA